MPNLSFIFSVASFRKLTACCLLSAFGMTGAMATSGSSHGSKPLNKCIAGAAQYHGVNPYLLRAILMVESQLNPKAINVNMNGTRDIGVA